MLSAQHVEHGQYSVRESCIFCLLLRLLSFYLRRVGKSSNVFIIPSLLPQSPGIKSLGLPSLPFPQPDLAWQGQPLPSSQSLRVFNRSQAFSQLFSSLPGPTEDHTSLFCCAKSYPLSQVKCKNINSRDFPSGPVVKTLPSNAGGWRFNPWSGN